MEIEILQRDLQNKCSYSATSGKMNVNRKSCRDAAMASHLLLDAAASFSF
jgi:hypothetical protein